MKSRGRHENENGVSPKNSSSLPSGSRQSVNFLRILFSTGFRVVFSSSTGLCYSPSGLLVFQYSLHPRLPLSPLHSSACDLKNNHLVSSRRLSTTFATRPEDRGGAGVGLEV